MRIVSINVLYAPYHEGGAEIIVKTRSEGLVKKGHSVDVITFTDKPDYIDSINGVTINRVKIPNIYLPDNKSKYNIVKRRLWHLIDIYNIKSKKIIKTFLKEKKPDIVIIDNIQGWSSSIWDAIHDFNIPTIQVLHDSYLLCPTNMFKNNRICKRRCLSCSIMRMPHKFKSNKIFAVVGVSNFILSHLLNYGYFKKSSIKKVIYNSRIINSKFNQVRTFDGNVIFGFIGNIAPNKGIENLIKIFCELERKNFFLYIAGNGKSSYLNYLQKKYCNSNIKYLGRITPEDFFPLIDFTIVPSIWYENFPNVIIESLYFGVPVIASNIGGIPELIKLGINGTLFNPFQTNELKESMLEFSNNIFEWKKNFNKIVETSYPFCDFEQWINQWNDLIKEIVNGD